MTVAAASTQTRTDVAAVPDVTVHRGDTLTAIAARHGVSLAELERANPQIANFDLIRPGQHVHLPGMLAAGTAASGGVGSAGLPTRGANANVAAIAEQYVGQNASTLEATHGGGRLPMQAGVDTHHCCANFVSAVLEQAGLLTHSQHTNSVAQLNRTLRAQGWTPVSAANARPGDVVIIQGGGVSHTEIVSGPGRMIGSNNVNPDRSQRVSHGNLSWALNHGAVILRPPAGAGQNTAAAAPATRTAAAPAGNGTQPQRTAQAVQYFESQGWTHAQASGIVANLSRESGLSPSARGDGGLAYGLGQWHPDRQANFRAFTGHSIQGSSFAEQLAFVNHELRTTEAGAGRRLAGATSASEAGSIVSQYYERPGDRAGEAAARGQLANQIAAGTR